MLLRDATPAERDDCLALTHGLWADGLDLPAYRDTIATVMSGDWAREGGYRFLVLVEDDQPRPLGCMKLYRFRALLDGEEITVGGIGAVFTPPENRGRGIAQAMLSRAHDVMTERGDAVSLLFSEIGADLYARSGYRELPSHHVRIEIPADGAAPAGLERMSRDAIEAVAAIRDAEDRKEGFSLLRDHSYWRFLLSRASYPTLHLGAEAWESRIMMAGQDGYLWSHFGGAHDGAQARILEFGERKPGAALSFLLDDFFAECRKRDATTAEAWMTSSRLARDARLAALATPVSPAGVVTMWLPLDEARAGALTLQEPSVAFHLTDLF